MDAKLLCENEVIQLFKTELTKPEHERGSAWDSLPGDQRILLTNVGRIIPHTVFGNLVNEISEYFHLEASRDLEDPELEAQTFSSKLALLSSLVGTEALRTSNGFYVSSDQRTMALVACSYIDQLAFTTRS